MGISYEYLNEDRVIIPEADDYELIYDVIPESVTKWQAIGTYYDNVDQRTNFFLSGLSDNPEASVTSEKRFKTFDASQRIVDSKTKATLGNTILVYDKPLVGGLTLRRYTANQQYFDIISQMLAEKSLRTKGLEISWIFPFFNSNDWHKLLYISQANWGRPPNGSEPNVYEVTRLETVENIEVLYVHPANGDRTVTLNIYQNQSLIFSRTTSTFNNPLVQKGKACLNNTCPVKCDVNICCYGNNGIATEAFLLSESIYE